MQNFLINVEYQQKNYILDYGTFLFLSPQTKCELEHADFWKKHRKKLRSYAKKSIKIQTVTESLFIDKNRREYNFFKAKNMCFKIENK